MSTNFKRIVWIALLCVLTGMMALSAFMKLSGAEELKKGMTQIGFGPYIIALGVVELLSAVLFIFPKTMKIGMLLLCSYLGGAFAIEISTGKPPVAAALIALVWIIAFLRNKETLLNTAL